MKITVSQLRRVIKEEVTRTLSEMGDMKKLSGSQERHLGGMHDTIIEEFPGIEQAPDVLKKAVLALRDYLKKGASVDKAWNEVYWNLEDGVYGQIPGYHLEKPEPMGIVGQITRR